MAFSRSQNDLHTIYRIDSALSLWNDDEIRTCTKEDGGPKITWKQILKDYYQKDSDISIYKYNDQCISPDFPFHDLVVRSKLLEDEELYEAILFSKIFLDGSDFDANYHVGELVWMEWLSGVSVILIHQNQVIYSIKRPSLDKIRQNVKPVWSLLKNKVRKNLIKAFGLPESIRDWSSYVSNVEFSSDDSCHTCAASTDAQASQFMTEEVKKIMLDELETFQLDARIKQQFVFDLKVLPNQDLYYWRGRLNFLRFQSSSAEVSSPESK